MLVEPHGLRPGWRAAALLVRVLGLMPLLPAAAMAGDAPCHQFERDGRRYSFRGSFLTKAERPCVLKVLFEFEHLVRFVAGADAIELTAEGEGWNEVRYSIDRWFLTHHETYRRTLTGGEPAILLELVRVEHHGVPLPLPETSRGHYDVRETADGVRVEYFQEAVLGPGALLRVHQEFARREAIRFLEDLARYIEAACVESPTE